MAKIKEESQKVIEENQKLIGKNQALKQDLSSEKQKGDQNLLPQYKEAFEQMRLANEMMQKKISEMENQRKEGKDMSTEQNQKVEEVLNEMKYKMQKFEYENSNLKDEREVYLNQIQSLENYNRNQEKMLQYFQQTYNNVMSSVHTQSQ